MVKSIMAVITFILMFGVVGINVSTAADTSQTKRKVVMQVNEDESKIWGHALTLAENMQKNAGKDNIEIEIVAMSPGIKMVGIDSSVSDRVSSAINNGIRVAACSNTMKSLRWGEDKLVSGVLVVPFGALEIIDKQREGWAYIKP